MHQLISRGRRAIPWGALSLIAFQTGCAYDADAICPEGFEVYGDDEKCVCPEDRVLVDRECVKCGKHEMASANGCVCDKGYSRSAPGESCKTAPQGQGIECSEEAPCQDEEYNFCQDTIAGGYCTTAGCESSAECSGGFACDQSTGAGYCRRPPLGLGTPCTSDADCEGTEATMCDTFFAMACIVKGCSLEPNNCFEGSVCCDVMLEEPICVPEGYCF